MFTTTFESYIAIGWTVYTPVGKVQHWILQLVQFLNFLNFQNHREHVYNNFWKFNRNRMNGACSCRESETPGTPASRIFKFFKFPKPPQECLQQLVKVSSQSDERSVLLYGKHRQTDRHWILYIRYICTTFEKSGDKVIMLEFKLIKQCFLIHYFLHMIGLLLLKLRMIYKELFIIYK